MNNWPDDLKGNIINAFRSSVYVDDRMDVQQTPIYDTVSIPAAGTVNELTTALFTNVGAQSGKTVAQTNMTQPQRLAAPEAFSVQGIAIRIQENILLADLLSILSTFSFAFYLGQKRYNLAPIWQYPAGGGIFGLDATADLIGNGLPSREARLALSIPIVIENQMQFYARLEGGTFTLAAGGASGTGLTMQVLLDGYYARGVQ